MLAVSEILELIALLPFLLRGILPILSTELREGLATSRDGSGSAGVTSKGFLSWLLGRHLVVTSLSILGHLLSKVNSYLAVASSATSTARSDIVVSNIAIPTAIQPWTLHTFSFECTKTICPLEMLDFFRSETYVCVALLTLYTSILRFE